VVFCSGTHKLSHNWIDLWSPSIVQINLAEFRPPNPQPSSRESSPAPTLKYDSESISDDDKTIIYDYPDDENSEKESSTKDDEAIGNFGDDRMEKDSVSASSSRFDESNAQGVIQWFPRAVSHSKNLLV